MRTPKEKENGVGEKVALEGFVSKRIGGYEDMGKNETREQGKIHH